MIAAAFPLDVRDSCGNFFGTALRAFDPYISPSAKVLEIGCAEFNWLDHAARAWPEMTFTGIDWRKSKPRESNVTAVAGDVMLTEHFPRETFDWVVSISAIEHIGLGHYDSDPKDVDGDTKAVMNAWRWLKPGGWFYLDVPWRADGFKVCGTFGTSHRIYDAAALDERFRLKAFWAERWRGFAATNKCDELLTNPPLLPGEQFHYVGLWLQKV